MRVVAVLTAMTITQTKQVNFKQLVCQLAEIGENFLCPAVAEYRLISPTIQSLLWQCCVDNTVFEVSIIQIDK